MAGPIYADLVKDTSSTTGTGTLTLDNVPPTGSQSFAAVGNGNTCYYMASTSDQAQVEVGLGTYSSTGPTLARNTVAYSTNGNAKVSFSAPITVELVAAAAFFSATQAASAVLVGDTGSGGTAGIVPAPAAGDAAAHKVLNADGTWAVPVAVASASVTNTMLANMAAGTIKGNNGGSSAAPSDLTAAQVTALLDVAVGDGGSGGTKGLVPAAGAGDAAAGKFLKADGSWSPAPGDIANGLSLLAFSAKNGSASAQNQKLAKLAAPLPTPTIYYDPSATSGNGSGSSAANACYTVAQLQAVATGDLPGVVIGFKRGTTTNTEVSLTIGSSKSDKPILIVPYGDDRLAAPLIDTGSALTGWTVYSGSIYQISMATHARQVWQRMADGTEKRIHWILDTTLANKVAKLNAAGGGYGFWDSNTFYCIPYGNVDPNSGIMIASVSTNPAMGSGGGGLVIQYSNVATTGNIIIYGLSVRHTHGAGINCSIGSSNSNITSIGPVHVVGCDVQHCGRPIDVVNALGATIMPNGGGDDGIIIYGKNNTVRTIVRVASNFLRDVGNNAVELSFVSGGYVEFNTSIDSGSHGLVENYASCSSVITRYNYATWLENQAYPWYINGTASWMGRITWQAGFDQTNYGSGSGQTNATASQSVGNQWIGNVAINCPSSGGVQAGTAVLDDGCPGIVFKNNIFTINAKSAQYTVPFIIGNKIADGTWAAAVGSPAALNNNIIVNNQTANNKQLLYVSPNYNSGYVPTGDNNVYFSNAADWFNYFKLNAVNANAISGPATLAAWVTASGMDAHSQFINPMLDANGQPYVFSPAIRCGAYAAKQALCEGYPLTDI
jgi:hypothetical protein